MSIQNVVVFRTGGPDDDCDIASIAGPVRHISRASAYNRVTLCGITTKLKPLSRDCLNGLRVPLALRNTKKQGRADVQDPPDVSKLAVRCI